MSDTALTTGIRAGRLDPAELADNFADLHPALDDHEAGRTGLRGRARQDAALSQRIVAAALYGA